MAKSKAKKYRDKRKREGFRHPELSRASWRELNPVTRKTPTKLEAMQKQETKYKRRLDRTESDDSIVFLYISKSVNTSESRLDLDLLI
ncbi:hypothetical protein PU629_11580 [Pullulanibacillus sp. KACC 23026]|uniref:hypothetical protein n=1 Tax=Pullulanibacillus sp. KACC 23026 TaxID=3028315 RepID=UPI0023B0EE09|nr:hypothetical protein [Pullulanibacillus sp. KACC 23026]WEG10824.1 hypothetical protein PU629_11580 [Pullulanibacillus sp. KACC 23026]